MIRFEEIDFECVLRRLQPTNSQGYGIRTCLFQLAFQTLISKFLSNISIEKKSNCEKTIFEKMRRKYVVIENEIFLFNESMHMPYNTLP